MIRTIFILTLVVFMINISTAQSWEIISESEVVIKNIRDIIPEKYKIYRIDDQELKHKLWQAPKEGTSSINSSDCIINVGMADGTIEKFKIIQYEMMEPELAEKYSYIRTFYGISVNNQHTSIRIDYTLQGFRAVVSSPEKGKMYIDHFQRDDSNIRIVYYREDYKTVNDWECTFNENTKEREHNEHPIINRIGDCQLRTYRLAQAANGEYSNYHGATSSAQSGLVLSAVTTVINRVNQVYETEVAVRLLLVANTTQIFYYNPSTDPYTNDEGGTMLGENISTCNSVIGSANYDIGHVFSTGGGGVAYLGCVCGSSKAGGVTGSSAPVGDPFSIDYVAHEMGHQFNANHTFAGWLGSCSGNRNNSTAFEPGSGTTIMAYAGICSTQNVQSNSDAYFHAISLQEIKTFLNGTGGDCDQIVNTFVNTAPNITAQSNYTIPKSTPFALTLSATDPENNPLTYDWEEMDGVSGNVTTPPVSTNTTGPMFRSISPTTTSTRYFPPLNNILNNTANTWQVLPSVSRTMNFRGVVRDFTGVAGCNSEINLTVSTVSAAGPFKITSQNTATSWYEGESYTITWDVSGTTANGINTANVGIFLSYDGGNSFPVTLVNSTANDGSENIVLPIGTSTTARIKVAAINNIYFDINDINISIVEYLPTFDINVNPNTLFLCPNEQKTSTVYVISTLGFSDPVTLAISNLPAGVSYSLSQNPVIPGQSSVLTLNNIQGQSGNYDIIITGTSGSITKQKNINIDVLPIPTSIVLSSPANNSSNQSIKPAFSWVAQSNIINYIFQISRDPEFGSFIKNITTTTNSYQFTEFIEGASTYYWRVKAINNCGSGEWSQVYIFQTASCFVYTSTNVPIAISATGTPTINSYLPITDYGVITDLDVLNLTGTHTYIDDLNFTLFAPSTTNVLIWNRPCSSENDFNINFDQSAQNSNWPCPPTDGLTYIPSNSLNTFNNQQIKGTWRLQVYDRANQDGGSLNSWKLKTCVNNFCRLTVNNTYQSGAGSLYAAYNCASTGDTIKISSSLQNDTIYLGANNMVFNKSVIIEGDISKNIHIISDGINSTLINNAPTSSNGLIIKGLHIHSGGSNSFAIENNGKLILENSIIHNYPGFTNTAIINNEGSSLEIKGNCQIKDQ